MMPTLLMSKSMAATPIQSPELQRTDKLCNTQVREKVTTIPHLTELSTIGIGSVNSSPVVDSYCWWNVIVLFASTSAFGVTSLWI